VKAGRRCRIIPGAALSRPRGCCSLTDEALMKTIADAAGSEIAIAGTMQTENLGNLSG